MKNFFILVLSVFIIGCSTVKESPENNNLHPFFALKGQTITVTPGEDYICLPVEEFNRLTR